MLFLPNSDPKGFDEVPEGKTFGNLKVKSSSFREIREAAQGKPFKTFARFAPSR